MPCRQKNEQTDKQRQQRQNRGKRAKGDVFQTDGAVLLRKSAKAENFRRAFEAGERLGGAPLAFFRAGTAPCRALFSVLGGQTIPFPLSSHLSLPETDLSKDTARPYRG